MGMPESFAKIFDKNLYVTVWVFMWKTIKICEYTA